MQEKEFQKRLAQLDWEEYRTKMQLQLFVTFPDAFQNQDKEWLNLQINERLDALRAIKIRREKLLAQNRKDEP